MGQRVRRQKNRKKVKGVAIRKNSNTELEQKVTKYGGGVRVVTYKKKWNKKNDGGE